MAQSIHSDFKIYNEFFDSGFVETLQQNTNAWNGVSGGAIRLVADQLKGHFEYDSLFDLVSGLVSRRDIDSTGTVNDTAMTQDEEISVKINRKVGPVAVSFDAMKKKGRDPREFSFILGQQTAKAVQVDYLDTALGACEAALDAVAALEHDASDGTITTDDVAVGLSKFGDAAGQVSVLVMHSKPYWDLVRNQITDAIYRADGVQIMAGIPATFNRPTIVTDSAALFEADEPSSSVGVYSTLGLVPGAIEVVESETPTMVTDLVTGYENIFNRIQGEHAYNLRLKGLRWKVASGNNPTDAALTTGSNWEKAVASNKLLPGILIRSR
jgi:hypothetical protein